MPDDRILLPASVGRSALVVAIPFLFLSLVVFALERAGYALSDYMGLIRSGKLSGFRQLLMWTAMVAFVAIYIPPALLAVRNPKYVTLGGGNLIAPNGKRFKLSEIKSIAVRKTFWHKILEIHFKESTKKIIITFAKGGTDEIRRDLSSKLTATIL
jgi:hypothetical protein